jgi:hypothetical protein
MEMTGRGLLRGTASTFFQGVKDKVIPVHYAMKAYEGVYV